jgi:hypothetical protein
MGVMNTMQTDLAPAEHALLLQLQAAVRQDPSDLWLANVKEHTPGFFVVDVTYRPAIGSSHKRAEVTGYSWEGTDTVIVANFTAWLAKTRA